jgi:hypothetical protein
MSSTGEKFQGMPAARVSAAVMRAAASARSGFQVAATPSGCGNRVAPAM